MNNIKYNINLLKKMIERFYTDINILLKLLAKIIEIEIYRK